LVIDQVKADIEEWLINFVEVPHPALGNWAPCPYARKARLDNKYTVRLGSQDLWRDLFEVAQEGMEDQDVIIYAYDTDRFPTASFFESIVDHANQFHLRWHDMIALADHPQSPEVVNGVKFNQGTYALVLVQSHTKLHSHAKMLADKGYYDGWDEDYLNDLFLNRTDPRK
jgi:hypothetical protein